MRFTYNNTEFGEFDKENADGTREYFICQEISFL